MSGKTRASTGATDEPIARLATQAGKPGRGGSGAFLNARVLPMRGPDSGPEPWRTEAQAILWENGAIVAIGSDHLVETQALKRGIAPEDLAGRIVIPGFVDAHTHFLHIGVKRHRPDLSGCDSKASALAAVAAWLADHPGDEPVIAERWDESTWPGRNRPTRGELDELVAAAALASHGPPDRMLVLRRVCGHVAVANTAALATIRRRWPSPALVDPATGLLLEDASLYLNEVVPTSAVLLDAALGEATRECLALGITTVGDYSQAPYRAALRRAADAGRLGIRVASSIYVQQLEDEIAAGFRTGKPLAGPDADGSGGSASDSGRWLRDGGLKVFLDGSLGAHTAALREPYGDSGHDHPNGLLNWSEADVERLFARAHKAGIQIHAHAIGDAAIDQGLAAFGNLLGGTRAREAAGLPLPQTAGGPTQTGPASPSDLRHRFEHFEIAHDEQLRRTAQLGLAASSQPNFVGTWSAKGGMYEARLGPRYRLNNRFQTMLANGIKVAFGSDGMPPGPLQGIAAAILHPEASQRLPAAQAVWHYTWWAAWSLHWEDQIGSLEPGKRADIVVLDQTSMDDVSNAHVWRVVIDGTPAVSVPDF